MPVRVQLRRTKGWRKPEGVVVCSRPGRWGNPFYVTPQRDAATCVRLFRNAVRDVWVPADAAHLSPACQEETHRIHRHWVEQFHPGYAAEAIKEELRGRDLGCWCGPDGPCHVDVLIEVANG